MEIEKSWTSLKSLIDSKGLLIQYSDDINQYIIWADELNTSYKCYIPKTDPTNADQLDFEANHKDIANRPSQALDDDGKLFVRAESRPLDMMTCFTMAGDHPTNGVGEGNLLVWDFSDEENMITAPLGYKRKRIDLTFNDVIRIKEGGIYFHNAEKGSYLDLYIVHPNPAIGKLAHYVIKHHFQGTCPMGDELNTEAASSEVPAGLILRLEITVPDTDNISNGYVSVELYRRSTV